MAEIFLLIDECENSLSDASNEREDAIKQMNNLRDEIKVWIEKLANISELLSKEDRIILNGMIQGIFHYILNIFPSEPATIGFSAVTIDQGQRSFRSRMSV